MQKLNENRIKQLKEKLQYYINKEQRFTSLGRYYIKKAFESYKEANRYKAESRTETILAQEYATKGAKFKVLEQEYTVLAKQNTALAKIFKRKAKRCIVEITKPGVKE